MECDRANDVFHSAEYFFSAEDYQGHDRHINQPVSGKKACPNEPISRASDLGGREECAALALLNAVAIAIALTDDK